MKEMIVEIEKKLQKFTQPRKSCQFWFWYEPSPQNYSILDAAKVKGKAITVVTMSNPKGEKVLKGIYLKRLREIIQEYTIR
jgi:hypothetical protein